MSEDGFHENPLGRGTSHLPRDTDILHITRIAKTWITINLDGDIITYFKKRGSDTAKGYQTLINDALRDYIALGSKTDVLSDLVERVRQLEKRFIE